MITFGQIRQTAKDIYEDVKDLTGENVKLRAEAIIATHIHSLLNANRIDAEEKQTQ
jgi:hypothetical protein